MDNDNVYQPRGGYYPTEPKSQVKERDEEVTKTLLAIPRLQEAVDHLDEQIALLSGPLAIPDDFLLDPAKFMHITYGNKVGVSVLTAERDWFIGLIQEASKE